jgi:Predicted NADH:ubiquinone oxidoreductase, subunit RnfA
VPYFIVIIVNAIFINNFLMSRFLGICSFLGVTKKLDTSIGMGLAVTFVMGIASIITYAVNLFLVRYHIEYLQTISFVLIVAGFIQVLELVIKKFSPALYSALGIYLPLITTNCAVLGVALINVTSLENANIFYAFLNGVASGLGYMLALLIMTGIRIKLETSEIPKAFQGFPIALIIGAIMSMGFAAFGGLQI